MDDEGSIDPLVTEWLAANPERSQPFEVLDPELLELARGDFPIGCRYADVDPLDRPDPHAVAVLPTIP